MNESVEENKKGFKNRCIGPCYPGGMEVLHPITLEYITYNEPFCPTAPWRHKLGGIWRHERCNKVTYKPDGPDEVESNFIIPKFVFNPDEFLKIYYRMFSIDDAVLWYNENPDVPYQTIRRIMDCALKVHGIDELYTREASDLMVEFTKFMILNYWFDLYFVNLTPHLQIIDEKIIFLKEPDKDNKLDAQQKILIKSNIEKLLTNLFVVKSLKKFVKHYKEEWFSMSNHTKKLQKSMLASIIHELSKEKID